MKIFLRPKFRRQFSKLTKDIQKEAYKKISIFRKNPFNPKLKTHKLKGRLERRWSFSINYNHRIIFTFINKEEVKFDLIGDHKIYK